MLFSSPLSHTSYAHCSMPCSYSNRMGVCRAIASFFWAVYYASPPPDGQACSTHDKSHSACHIQASSTSVRFFVEGTHILAFIGFHLVTNKVSVISTPATSEPVQASLVTALWYRHVFLLSLAALGCSLGASYGSRCFPPRPRPSPGDR